MSFHFYPKVSNKPGPAQGFVLLKGRFSCRLYLNRILALKHLKTMLTATVAIYKISSKKLNCSTASIKAQSDKNSQAHSSHHSNKSIVTDSLDQMFDPDHPHLTKKHHWTGEAGKYQRNGAPKQPEIRAA